MTCRWKCWKRYWWEGSWCCIPVTARLITTAGHTSLVNVVPLSGEHSFYCPQFAATGTRLWLDGRSHQLRTGSDISSRSWLSVSTFIIVVHLEQSGQLGPDCWLVGTVTSSGASISFPRIPPTLTPICRFSPFFNFNLLLLFVPSFFLSFVLFFFCLSR